MKMSVREARSNFAHALDLADKGKTVTITKNGKPIAELGPPRKRTGFDWERAERVRKDLGLDTFEDNSDELPFTGPEWTQEVWGAYFAKLDKEVAKE